VTADQPGTSTRLPLRLWWRAAEPDAVTALLERLGASVRDGSIGLGPVVLTVVAADSEGIDRLEVGDALSEPMEDPGPNDGPRLAALGWAGRPWMPSDWLRHWASR
jgi:hypothetical protein